jgi:tetratricopeptide (TPR) repeat protein
VNIDSNDATGGSVVSASTEQLSAGGRPRGKLIVGGVLLLIVLSAIGGWWTWDHYAARSRWQAARDAAARRDWAEAEKHLNTYQRLRPDDPAGLLLSARISRRLGHLRDAKSALDAAEDRLGRQNLGVKVERALQELQGGDLDGTEEFLRDAISKDPDDADEILDLLSAALIRNLRITEANTFVEESLRRNPDDFEMLVRHGFTADAQGWYPVAAESLQKAVAIRPDAGEVRLSLAQALINSGKYDEARKQLDILRQGEPENRAVTFALARCMAHQGEKEPAAKLLDEMLASEPDNPLLLGERGWVSLELDRPKEALPFLRRAQARAEHDKVILSHLANCLNMLGKPDEARPLQDEVKRITDETQKTSLLTRQILEEKPQGPEPYHELGSAYQRLGQQKLAFHYFRKALQKNPRYGPTHEALADLYKSVGDYERAAAHRRQAGSK